MSRILLTCGPWLAEAAGDLGGNLVRLEYSGRPLLRTPSQAPDPYLFGSPMLFPANRTCKGRFSFLGREYRLPINEPANQAHLHGLVHAQDFSLLGRTEREAAFLFENRSEAYPFSFRLSQTGLYGTDLLETISLRFSRSSGDAFPPRKMVYPKRDPRSPRPGQALPLFRPSPGHWHRYAPWLPSR